MSISQSFPGTVLTAHFISCCLRVLEAGCASRGWLWASSAFRSWRALLRCYLLLSATIWNRPPAPLWKEFVQVRCLLLYLPLQRQTLRSWFCQPTGACIHWSTGPRQTKAVLNRHRNHVHLWQNSVPQDECRGSRQIKRPLRWVRRAGKTSIFISPWKGLSYILSQLLAESLAYTQPASEVLPVSFPFGHWWSWHTLNTGPENKDGGLANHRFVRDNRASPTRD